MSGSPRCGARPLKHACIKCSRLGLVGCHQQPGNEIQAPMGVVILGGLLSSTALKMLVVLALYARFAREEASEPQDEAMGNERPAST
ncbi:MAG: hypothetical protein HY901_17245 [Deltaproteobacteria bacterium]|nr:hypothetical protein [Deltaproteobacteria bacterium]